MQGVARNEEKKCMSRNKKNTFTSEAIVLSDMASDFSREVEKELLDNQIDIHGELPLLPLQDNVLFPGSVLPVTATRQSSRRLLRKAERSGTQIGVVTQRNEKDLPSKTDLYTVGCIGRVLKVLDLPNGEVVGVLQGIKRFIVADLVEYTPYILCTVESVLEEDVSDFDTLEARTLVKELVKSFNEITQWEKNNFGGVDLSKIKGERIMVNYICTVGSFETADKQRLLETSSYIDRINLLLQLINDKQVEHDIIEEIHQKAGESMRQQHREYILQQQMRVIQTELSNDDVLDPLLQELREKASNVQWTLEALNMFNDELKKLQSLTPQQPEYSVMLNYLNFLVALPWLHMSTDILDISYAKTILDRDHYGLDKVKERIIEYLAVMQLRKDMKAPILCFVGPPGTGKTSLGKSIADAMGRKYIRMALGGLHDESEIRGHRRTYVGAMAGRIMECIKRAGTSNPVFVLDEIDKVQTNTLHGDPTSALLEVLDPEQNVAFHDNFLDLDYDLSHVMFIATANSVQNIQPALLDRLEIIELSGYVEEEKIEIAKQHLIPKQLKEHGYKRHKLKFSDETLHAIINKYTREAGVRQLDKAIAKIVRRKAVKLAEGTLTKTEKQIQPKELDLLLGAPLHTSELRLSSDTVGVATGMAWTSVGGEILFLESNTAKGKGQLVMTGNLGDVMKESATIALEYLKIHGDELQVPTEDLDSKDIFLHVPEGATPKDGPSAGVAMLVTMASTFARKKVRADVSMTGEITLRGAVTPVGGIKEKVLAAKRAGIEHIIMPADNRRDVEEISPNYLNGLTFHYVSQLSEVLPLAFANESKSVAPNA